MALGKPSLGAFIVPKMQGLYAIVDTGVLGWDKLIPAATAAIQGGARIIQFRDKSTHHHQRQAAATALQTLCQQHQVLFIINDDVALAAKIGADGVHLGQDDVALSQARQVLPTSAIIGISCYNDLALANAVVAAGADYVAFGAFFSSSTKPQAQQAQLTVLQAAKQQLSVPVVAIGGITPENAAPLVAAGADMLAVISGLWHAPNITLAAKRYNALFSASLMASND